MCPKMVGNISRWEIDLGTKNKWSEFHGIFSNIRNSENLASSQEWSRSIQAMLEKTTQREFHVK